MKERQKQQLRHKALKKGLDPEALTGKYPVSFCLENAEPELVINFSISSCQQPKIQVASKYERRVDTRSYDDKKKLFEGVSICRIQYLIFPCFIYHFDTISNATDLNLFYFEYVLNFQPP